MTVAIKRTCETDVLTHSDRSPLARQLDILRQLECHAFEGFRPGRFPLGSLFFIYKARQSQKLLF